MADATCQRGGRPAAPPAARPAREGAPRAGWWRKGRLCVASAGAVKAPIETACRPTSRRYVRDASMRHLPVVSALAEPRMA